MLAAQYGNVMYKRHYRCMTLLQQVHIQKAHSEGLSMICKALADTVYRLLCLQRLQSMAVSISISQDMSQEEIIDAP